MTNRTRATVVADSEAYGHRLTTMELVMHPRAVEHLLTHRALSRNGASRRAIPLAKQIEDVEIDPCFPLHWGAEQRGMQSGDEIDEVARTQARIDWIFGKTNAIQTARRLGHRGVHKEIASAPLHPFQWRTYLVSATDEGWAGFLRLRLSPLAQAEIRAVAQAVESALDELTPVVLSGGDWHLPYMEQIDRDLCLVHDVDPRMVSAMRCARVSYKNHGGGERDVKADAEKGWGLAQNEHWSALEHVATPAGPTMGTANFRGWQQLRTMMGA